MILLDTGTPGTSREIYSEDASSSLTIGIVYSVVCLTCYHEHFSDFHGVIPFRGHKCQHLAT